MKIVRKPEWLKIRLPKGEKYSEVKQLVEDNKLHTICSSGKCPNISECWSKGTATLMILGDICTRACKFCATKTGKPLPPDLNEPLKIARTVNILKLKHVVITSVDRDDLPDFGAQHWAETIIEVKKMNPETIVEILIPDFQGNEESMDLITQAKPDIIAHNLETVRSLTPKVRSKADYYKSLKVLNTFSDEGFVTKSGIMLGLGETIQEVEQTMLDLISVGCQIITLGQYLQPTPSHLEVVEYVHPDTFALLKEKAYEIGFKQVESGPLVRSSYMAEQSFNNKKH